MDYFVSTLIHEKIKTILLFIYLFIYCFSVVGRDSIVGILTLAGWTVRESNPDAGETFHTRPDRLWGPPTLLYSGYQLAPKLKKE